MKQYLLLLAFILTAKISLGQVLDTPRYTVYYDKTGVLHTSTTATKLSTITGLYTDLLNIPNITINGNTQSLATGPNFTVTSTPYTASAPLNLASFNFSIPVANATTSGYLPFADWNTFNNKQQALIPGTGIGITGPNITNTAPDQTVVLTAGNGIVITGTYPNFTISQIAPTIATPTRTLNSNFTVSASKPAFVYYTLSVSVTNPLIAGTSVGSAFLEYSTNSGTTWLPVTSIGNSSNVGITVTIQLTNLQTGMIGGVIPTNALVRIRTTTSGTATVSFVSATEVVY